MKKLKTPLIYLAIILVIVIAITGLEKGNSAESKKIEYTDFVAMVKRGGERVRTHHPRARG